LRFIILAIIFALLVPLAGYVTVEAEPFTLILAAVGVAIFFISFVNIEIGLYILILSMLLSPEIGAGQTAGASLGRGVTLRYEDFLLVIIGASWFAKNAVFKEIGLFRHTELNHPDPLVLFGLYRFHRIRHHAGKRFGKNRLLLRAEIHRILHRFFHDGEPRGE
jgi:hypothetical protein